LPKVTGSSTLNVLLFDAELMLKLSWPLAAFQAMFWKLASWRVSVKLSHRSAFQIGTPLLLA
jgi:hypothetical protein